MPSASGGSSRNIKQLVVIICVDPSCVSGENRLLWPGLASGRGDGLRLLMPALARIAQTGLPSTPAPPGAYGATDRVRSGIRFARAAFVGSKYSAQRQL